MEVLAYMSMDKAQYEAFTKFENGKMNPDLAQFLEEVAQHIEKDA